MNRRQLLATIGTGMATLLAGFLSDDDDEVDEPEPDDPEQLEREWNLRGRVVNEDNEPHDWRVESRSRDRESVAAASASIPAGESWEFERSGQLFDEQREVYVEAGEGSVSEAWRTVECPQLSADIVIAGGIPQLETACREE